MSISVVSATSTVTFSGTVNVTESDRPFMSEVAVTVKVNPTAESGTMTDL